MMPDHGIAFRAARPVLAGHILVGGRGGTIGVRAGEDIVIVHHKQAAHHLLAGFGDPGIDVDVGFCGIMQVRNAGGDGDAVGVHPRPLADAILCIDRALAAHRLLAEVGAPGLAAGAGLGGEITAMLVGALKTTEVRAVRTRRRGDEKRHVRILRRSRCLRGGRADHSGRQCGRSCHKGKFLLHWGSSMSCLLRASIAREGNQHAGPALSEVIRIK